MDNWKERFEIVYKIYCSFAIQHKERANKSGMSTFLGITQGKMQRWEAGSEPSAKDCLAISDKLGIDLRWLITGEGQPQNTVKPLGQDYGIEKLEMLQEIVESLEELVIQVEISLTPSQKAKVVRSLFEHFLEEGPVASRKSAHVLRLIKGALA